MDIVENRKKYSIPFDNRNWSTHGMIYDHAINDADSLFAYLTAKNVYPTVEAAVNALGEKGLAEQFDKIVSEEIDDFRRKTIESGYRTGDEKMEITIDGITLKINKDAWKLHGLMYMHYTDDEDELRQFATGCGKYPSVKAAVDDCGIDGVEKMFDEFVRIQIDDMKIR